MKPITFLSTGFLLLFTSCFTAKKTTMSVMPLYETKWLLKKIYSQNKMQEIQTKAFIKLDEEKKRAGGNGSCNTYGSSLIVVGNSISFGNIFSTKMFCEGVQQTEDLFLRQLENVNRFAIKGKNLLLYHDKELLLEFAAE